MHHPFLAGLRNSHPLALLLLTACLPASAQELSQASADLCRPMAPEAIYGITALVLIGSFVALSHVDRRLKQEGWSLANALSEPTQLQVPMDPRWLDSIGDKADVDDAGGDKPPTNAQLQTVTVLEASTSRLIALVGMIVILLMYLGFGIFSLFNYGFTCSMPASSGAVTAFLYSGLTLFAPYVANKFSSVFQPMIRQAGVTSKAPKPMASALAPQPAQPKS
jgi:hypothetical protein